MMLRRVHGLIALSCVLVAACVAPTPQDLGNMAMQRTAFSVVYPIMNQRMIGPDATAASQCIVTNATAVEIQLLAQDFGGQIATRAQTITGQVLARPATRACLAAAGLANRGI